LTLYKKPGKQLKRLIYARRGLKCSHFVGPRKISASFQRAEQIELCRLCQRFDGVVWLRRLKKLVGMMRREKLVSYHLEKLCLLKEKYQKFEL